MKQHRTPRPIGTTELGHLYHKDKDNVDTYTNYINHILNHYVNTGFTYCNKALSIEQFHHYTGIPIKDIYSHITKAGKDAYLQADPNDQGEMLRAILGITLSSVLSDRSAAIEQYDKLRVSQGDGYKAFVSSEVNKALKLRMEASNGLLALAKSMGGAQGLSVTINNHVGDKIGNQQNNFLTTEKALELITNSGDSKSLLEAPQDKQKLYETHEIADMPIVKANQQQGLDTSKEGLNFNKLVTLSDDKIDHIEGPKSHINRRALELDIDLESDEI